MTPGPDIAEKLKSRFFKTINWIGIILTLPMLMMAGVDVADSPTFPEQVISAIATLLFPVLSVIGLIAKRLRWFGMAGLVLMVSVRWLTHEPWPTEIDDSAYFAVRAGDAPSLHIALAQGAAPDMYTWDRGYLLSAAALENDPEIIKILIDAGADVNIRKSDWSTPLLRAVYLRKCEAAVVLLEAGASPEDRFYDHANYTALPTDYGKTVAEIYQRQKIAWRRSWERNEACWLRFEQVLKHPPPSAWTARRLFQEVVLQFLH